MEIEFILLLHFDLKIEKLMAPVNETDCKKHRLTESAPQQ
jgi:hypothetical protein